MTDIAFLEALGILLIAAAAVVLLARLVRMPSIVSYILAGLLIGPLTGLLTPVDPRYDALHTIGELGIALLMFLVGLELNLARIRQIGSVALAAGLGQVGFTAAGGFVLCLALGFTVMESVFIATALTFSSTVVVVKLLDQKQDLHTLYGRIAVGIFLVQDLVVIVALTFLSGLGSPEMLEPAHVARSLGLALVGVAGLLGACLLAARYLLPGPLGWASRSAPTLFVWSLAWCLGFVVAADALELSAEIGALLAGLSIAQLPFAHELRRRVHPLMSFFIVVFFVSLGAQMDLSEAAAYRWEALALSLFVLIGNPLIFIWIIARYGYSERTCVLTSVTVAQISEFSFILAAMGLQAGLIRSAILSVVAVVGVVTIGVSSYMILYNEQLYRWLAHTGVLRIFRAGQHVDDEPPAERLRDHVIVIGMNELGRRLARTLHEQGHRVLAMDRDRRKLADLPCQILVGDVDHGSTLEEAGLPQAQLVVTALRIELSNQLLVFRCKRLGVPVAVYVSDAASAGELRDARPNFLMESKSAASQQILETLADRGLLAPC